MSRIYNTKQKEIILDFLKSKKNQHVSAYEIKNHIYQSGKSVGLTTIYRQLDHLVNEKVINKITVDQQMGSVYEYRDAEHECFHLKCENCQDIVHFHCHKISHLSKHMNDDHGFKIDTSKIIFYGLCKNCSKTKEKL